MSFSIDRVVLHPFSIPLKMPFRISAGEIREKNGLIVEVRSGDLTGWGEASVDKVPFYAHETVGSVIDLLTNSLIPLGKNVWASGRSDGSDGAFPRQQFCKGGD